MRRRLLLETTVVAILFLCSVAYGRTWTDDTGKFSIEAEFVEEAGEKVRLKKPDGMIIDVPLAKLCLADRQFVESQQDNKTVDPFAPASQKPVQPVSTSADQAVLAEGSGTSPAEALKDAFRNAVRQVVGAVVDAETLVKNDELIDDKILTYSDGFIKTYEKVPGSEKEQDGIYRIEIKANVERRSVVAKLKAANVTVKEVDGKGLFAEALSQLDAEQNLEAMLRKEFEDFPQSVLTANLVGSPKIIDKTGEKAKVRFQIQLESDLKAYNSFVERLQSKLDKLALDKGEFTAVFRDSTAYTNTENADFRFREPKDTGGLNGIMAPWMPKCFKGDVDSEELKTDRITLVVASSRSETGERLECKYYLLDKSVKRLLTDLAFRRGSGKLSLLDHNGTLVLAERFDLFQEFPNNNTDGFEGTLISAYGPYFGDSEIFTCFELAVDFDEQKPYAFLFWVSPVFFSDSLQQKSSLTISLELEMSLDELKSVKDAKCEILFK